MNAFLNLPLVKGEVVTGGEEVITETTDTIKVIQTPVTKGKPPPQTISTTSTSTSTTSATSTSSPSTSTKSTISLTLLSNLQELRHRLELAESGLTSHLHIPLGDNSVHTCTVHIQKLQVRNLAFLQVSFKCLYKVDHKTTAADNFNQLLKDLLK